MFHSWSCGFCSGNGSRQNLGEKMFGKILQAILMSVIAYIGVFVLYLSGVAFSSVIFSEVGLIVVFLLALTYTFYFRL